MLFSRSFISVIRDVKFHEFVESSEAIAKGSVFNSFLISDDIVVKSFETVDRVDQEVAIPGDLAHWVVEERNLHDLWQGSE